MALQTIGLGTAANDGTGDDLRTAGGKLNNMFGELYGRARLIVNRQVASGNFMTVGSSFTTIVLNTVTLDTASKYNTTTGFYNVPTTGTYAIFAKLRLQDGTDPGINYGIGVDTSNVDNAGFAWMTSSTAASATERRNGHNNNRLLQLTAGDNLRLYAYVSGGQNIGIQTAELNVWQIA